MANEVKKVEAEAKEVKDAKEELASAIMEGIFRGIFSAFSTEGDKLKKA